MMALPPLALLLTILGFTAVVSAGYCIAAWVFGART